MRKTATVSALALLLVTGCSAADAQPAEPDPAASAADVVVPAAEPAAPDSEQQTCGTLLGTNGKGPLYQSLQIVNLGEGTFGFAPSTPEATRQLHESLLSTAGSSPEDMAPLLEELSAATAGALAAGGQGAAVTFDPFAWSGAVTELLTRCAPYEAGGTSAPAAPDLATLAGVGARFPGYPLVVDAASVDYRVAAWLGGKLVDGRVVALAPGLYAPYDPALPDLAAYYVSDGASGGTAMKQTVFPGSGGAGTFAMVKAGVQEP